MTQSVNNLLTIVDTLQAEGKSVTVTKLPPARKGYRKSAWCKQAKAPRQKVYA